MDVIHCDFIIYPPALCTKTNKLCYPVDPTKQELFQQLYNAECFFPSDIRSDPNEQYRFICTECNNYVHPSKGSKKL